MQAYLDLLKHIKSNGIDKDDRTGTGIRSVFGYQMRFPSVGESFPVLTTKKLNLKAIIHELLWFIKGADENGRMNNSYLEENGVNIWKAWADPATGDLGHIYGAQWRSWRGCDGRSHDQLHSCIDLIRIAPTSRRILVNTWNVGELDDMALPPCHCLFQFYVRGEYLDCQLYQRSADVFLGVPFNIASYSLLLMMIAKITGLKAGNFIHTFGDVHIYNNHFDQVDEQLGRTPKSLPKMLINGEQKNIDDFRYEDFELVGYEADLHIKAEVSV